MEHAAESAALRMSRAVELDSLKLKEKREATWRIRLPGKEEAQVKASISSSRAEVQEKTAAIKK